MTAHRANTATSRTERCDSAFMFLGVSLLAAVMSMTSPAKAQVADEVVLNILRECSRIDEPSARLACYDNNVGSAGGVARNTVPGQVRVEGGSGPGIAANRASGPTGFGREDVRTPERFAAAPPGELTEITARVTAIRQREPGIYAFTLEGGAQWVFTQSVGAGYVPPQVGSTVEIRRAALGSFLMRFNDQESVRVRRVS